MKFSLLATAILVSRNVLALPIPNQTPAFDIAVNWGAHWPSAHSTPKPVPRRWTQRRSEIESEPEKRFCGSCLLRRFLGLDTRTEDGQGGVAVENVGGTWFLKSRTEDGGGGKKRDGGVFARLEAHDGRGMEPSAGSVEVKRAESIMLSKRQEGVQTKRKQSGWNAKKGDISSGKRGEIWGGRDVWPRGFITVDKKGEIGGGKKARGFITVDKKGEIGGGNGEGDAVGPQSWDCSG